MMFGGAPRNLESEMTRVMDQALETLRSARMHPHDPQASRSLRELQARLGYLAQAMTWHTDGNEAEAEQALGLALGQSIREQDAVRRMWEEMWWSH